MKNEINKIEYDKTRMHSIWESKTTKQVKKTRHNT